MLATINLGNKYQYRISDGKGWIPLMIDLGNKWMEMMYR